MIKGTYEYLKALANFNECADHHSPLEVAWHSTEECYVLRCGEDHYPDAITRQLSLTQEYKAGADIPKQIKSNIEKGMAKRGAKPLSQEIPFKLEGVPNKDLATGELLDPAQVMALMEYAYKYHLDPFRGHLVLMYGKPYITIDGYLFHAKGTGVPYTLMGHPMTEDEKKAHMIELEDHAWLAIVRFSGTNNSFTGIGIVTQAEIAAKSTKRPEQLRSPVVAAHPWQLAQKRAEWQALRRAFPIGESNE